MKIIIIEDELKAARSLETLITRLRPDARIIAKIQSIESAVTYFTNHETPDLVFMDIQLADGLCFDIFKAVTISCPIIFCTAFGEYTLEAIKANGVDYLLKPFSEEDLETALTRVESFKNFFQQYAAADLEKFIQKIDTQENKTSFLVYKHQKYITVEISQIAYLYIQYASPSIVTFSGEEYSINQSLDQVQQQLSDKQFYRLNRQYLINFSAIKEVEHYFSRKLFIRLVVPSPEKLLIGKEKTTAFLQWLENR